MTQLIASRLGRPERLLASVLILSFVATASTVSAPAAFAEAPPPAAAFFSEADVSSVKLSPSGRHLALAVAGKSGRTLLAVAEVGSEAPPVVVASTPQADVYSFDWVNDERLVYNVADSRLPAYDQNFGPGLFSVKRDGSDSRQLIRVRWEPVREGTHIVSIMLEANHYLLRTLRDGSDDVLVAEYRYDQAGNRLSSVPKRLNTATGRASAAVAVVPSNVQRWFFDPNGRARAVETSQAGTHEVLWLDDGNAAWRSILKAVRFNLPWEPVDVDTDGNLYVEQRGSDSTTVLKRFDFAGGKPETAALAKADGFDINADFVVDGRSGKLAGLRINTDAQTTVWFNARQRKLQEEVDAHFPGRINRIDCSDCSDDGAVLVFSYSDRAPGSYLLFRPGSHAWATLGQTRRAIDPQAMADLDLHRIKARDGLDLPVWVTMPRAKLATPRPAVVLVHGGPFVRGVHWQWDADAQFLASRGYVVIEPEFRGSTGYGARLFRAGWKNWGTTMQDDVADAVRWAISEKLIDGKRVCIAGASYGGYATLMGAIRYPDLYRCGIAWVAVTDPRLLLETSWKSDISKDAIQYSLTTLIGDPVTDAAMLKAAAPVERAAEIKIPMLMAFGQDDARVPIEHGDRMRSAMRAAGQNPEYVVYNGEGHGWFKVENRIDFWNRVEAFLAKNLGS